VGRHGGALSRRGILAESKRVSLVPAGQESRRGERLGGTLYEEGLSSFGEPGSMLYTYHDTEVQFLAKTNQCEVLSVRRFEVSKVEAL